MSNGDATAPSRQLQDKTREINRNYRGYTRMLRLMIAEAEYALELHESELGAPSVRAGWRARFERLWRARHDPETAAREALLYAVVFAERNYSEPHVGWQRPRESLRTYVAKNARGQAMSLMMSVPFEDEAAAEAIESVAQFDPENASKIPQASLAALIPVFRDRHKNHGRRGKATTIDQELCKVVRLMGLTPVTPYAMRRQRVRFERMVNQRKAEEVRALHLEALRLEREQRGL